MTLTVAIYLFKNVEVLDFAGPFEVFTTASRLSIRRNPQEPPPFKVITVAKTHEPVQARAGLNVLPDFTMQNCPHVDLLIIPGGVVDEELQDEQLITWIQNTASLAKIVASVCTGSFLLAKAGLLHRKKATTHWEDITDFQRLFPEVEVQNDVRWVDEGQIVSSAGIAAGIDMSLHLVGRITSPVHAQATARQMDVPYRIKPNLTK
jgi:transcriptional regulator GlxA family with amidase domain